MLDIDLSQRDNRKVFLTQILHDVVKRRIKMKTKTKFISFIMVGVIMLSLCSCGSNKDIPADTPAEVRGNIPSDSISIEDDGLAGQEQEADESKLTRLAEYQLALQQIAFSHTYPDGRDTGFDSMYGSMEDNQFAICDVNGDGEDELIVHFTTAPMAGNTETVYGFQKEDKTLRELLTAAPNLTYYANGLIKEDWSHGSELAGEGYWPYTLYQYDAAEGCYQEIAQVNMWSKAIDTVDFKGDPYPDDIDAEGAGTVFILTRQGEVETVSKSDYEKWLVSTLDLTSGQDIPYQELSEENIEAVTAH